MYGCAHRFHGIVRMCVRARVCIDASIMLVHRGMYGCPDAHAHAHPRPHLRLAAAHILVHARTCGHTCMRVSMARHQHAYIGITCMCVYIHITMSISLLYIYYVLICMHVCWYVRAALCAQASIGVCTRIYEYRWVHVYLSPSIHLNMYAC